MKLKNLLIVVAPPALAITSIAIFNPSVLSWPVVALLALVVGGFGGLCLRLLEGR